ncbi:hypothetical protein SDC9_199430 [bioreactor metagenome]|uniref:Uncharacterized protein n=1 Tax=bioreactor metagenome TaxID=1076179 RepID=A0A645IKH9_9ZZZZ
MATLIPSLCKTPGVLKDLFLVSTFVLEVRVGPTTAGTLALFIYLDINSPSVQCSKVKFTSNSFAILIAVNISSAL